LEHYHSAQARPQLREKDGRVVHAGAAICEVAELRQVFEAGLCDEVAAERRKQAPPQRRQDQEQERNEAAAEKLARARVPEEDRLDGSRPGKGDQEGRPEQRPNGERARDPLREILALEIRFERLFVRGVGPPEVGQQLFRGDFLLGRPAAVNGTFGRQIMKPREGCAGEIRKAARLGGRSARRLDRRHCGVLRLAQNAVPMRSTSRDDATQPE